MELQEDSASMYRKTKILNLFRNKLVGDLIHHLIFVNQTLRSSFICFMYAELIIDRHREFFFFFNEIIKHDESFIKDYRF